LRVEVLRLLKSFPEVGVHHWSLRRVHRPYRLVLVAGVVIAGQRKQTELAYVLRDLEQRLGQHDFIGLALLTLGSREDDPRPSTVVSPVADGASASSASRLSVSAPGQPPSRLRSGQ
jgi:hypothetical protein